VSRLSRGQKVRLGVFVLVGLVALLGTIGVLIAQAALGTRDVYYIRLPSVGGLSPGSQVRYRGLRVGRVEELRITPGDVESVRVAIALDEGTPIKADTTAVLEMQGVTGLRYVELSGGTNDAPPLPPGGTIPAVGSTFELLSERASSITEKIERITARLATLTEGISGERIERAVSGVESTIARVRELVEQATGPAVEVLERAATLATALEALAHAGEDTLGEASSTLRKVREWVDPEQLGRLVGSLERASRAAERRLSDDDLGATLLAFRRLAESAGAAVGRADLTLVQIKDDLLRALDELVTGAEAFAEFASLLREDPAALIRGRGDAPREIK